VTRKQRISYRTAQVDGTTYRGALASNGYGVSSTVGQTYTSFASACALLFVRVDAQASAAPLVAANFANRPLLDCCSAVIIRAEERLCDADCTILACALLTSAERLFPADCTKA
jgi:hypothetical protein